MYICKAVGKALRNIKSNLAAFWQSFIPKGFSWLFYDIRKKRNISGNITINIATMQKQDHIFLYLTHHITE